MLINVDSGKEISNVPHRAEYMKWRKQLQSIDKTAFDRECQTLNEVAESNDVLTSSWIPGHNWHGTVYQQLYYACRCHAESAAKFYGLILFEVMINHKDSWGLGRYEKDGRPIRGISYFRLKKVIDV